MLPLFTSLKTTLSRYNLDDLIWIIHVHTAAFEKFTPYLPYKRLKTFEPFQVAFTLSLLIASPTQSNVLLKRPFTRPLTIQVETFPRRLSDIWRNLTGLLLSEQIQISFWKQPHRYYSYPRTPAYLPNPEEWRLIVWPFHNNTSVLHSHSLLTWRWVNLVSAEDGQKGLLVRESSISDNHQLYT